MLNTILNKKSFKDSDIEFLLNLTETSDLNLLFNKASEIKHQFSSTDVYIRGLIELSNICNRDCLYCGIRKSNKKFKRFILTSNEIIKYAEIAYLNKIPSLVIQAGERTDDEFIDFIESVLYDIKQKFNNSIRITLSLGEQTLKTYQRWFTAGAQRYLLRIETSNPDLYTLIHPDGYSFDERKRCLGFLKEAGYQVGTGFLIGFPEQRTEDLVGDLNFLKKNDIDMVGMGPYIPHRHTPMGKLYTPNEIEKQNRENLLLGLKMIAVGRIYLKDVNIASTTALETLSKNGLEKGIKAGGNVIMPNLTDTEYKKSYNLYDNKPCLKEDYKDIINTLDKRIKNCGEKIVFNEWGDSLHYKNRNNGKISDD